MGDNLDEDDRPIELPISKQPIGQRRKGRAAPSSIVTNQPLNDDTRPRDPRFDPRCNGSDDPRHFVRNYAFLEDVRKKELDELNKAFRREKDVEKRQKIRMTITRYKNKLIDLKNKATELPKKKTRISSGDKKARLVEQYKELKQSGKLTKYLERKRKKLIKRDQKAF